MRRICLALVLLVLSAPAFAAAQGVTVTRIGTVTAGEGVELRHKDQVVSVPKPGYRHF